MKQIEFTSEYKEKLLEMCKALFPEYEDIDFISKDQEGNYSEEDFIVLDDIVIHWFEFCLTHLFTAVIVKPYGFESIAHAMENGHYLIFNSNPIEYLYKIFKQ